MQIRPKEKNHKDQMIYEFEGLRIHYDPSLDGCGTWMASPITEHIRKRGAGSYKKGFEWCSGPGFIGLTALWKGICENLVLADRHPKVKSHIEKTRELNSHENLDFLYYESDNFSKIPKTEKFDLVMANPPNYYSLNPKSSVYDEFRDDHRPIDPGWKTHEEFYLTVGEHLNPGADLFIAEVEPEREVVYLDSAGDEPYDIRNHNPLERWKEMIDRGGLEYVGCEWYFTADGADLFLVRSRKPE